MDHVWRWTLTVAGHVFDVVGTEVEAERRRKQAEKTHGEAATLKRVAQYGAEEVTEEEP